MTIMQPFCFIQTEHMEVTSEILFDFSLLSCSRTCADKYIFV